MEAGEATCTRAVAVPAMNGAVERRTIVEIILRILRHVHPVVSSVKIHIIWLFTFIDTI